MTYAGAALSLSGFVSEKLSFARTTMVQLASSFVTLVTPAAVGGAAMNVRYLQRRKIPPAVAVASVGVNQVVAFVLHILLLAVFGAITGSSTNDQIKPPTWAYFVVAGLLAIAVTVLAAPGRAAAWCGPGCRRPSARCCRGCSRSRSIRASSPRGSAARCCSASPTSCAWPRASRRSAARCRSEDRLRLPDRQRDRLDHSHPRGLGAVEAALTAGLTARGMPGAVAVSAVLLFRLLTFWLPVPVGWAAMHYLERNHDL